MSFRIFPLCLLLSVQLLVFQSTTAQSFKGKWQGTRHGNVGTMTFDNKGHITFINDGKEVGGKHFTSEGVDLTMRYEYNDNVEPHTLDFIISFAKGGEELTRMPGIYQFINDRTLIINIDLDGKTRPKFFNDKDKNQIILMKIK